MKIRAHPLIAGRPWLTRDCLWCGQLFKTQRVDGRFCSWAHYMRQWRALKKLEGTHGQRPDGQFGRLA